MLYGLLAGICYCVTSTPALAAAVNVPNFSFENPDIIDSGAVGGTGPLGSIPNWLGVTTNPSTITPGLMDYTDAQFPGSTGDNTPLPGTALGGQAGLLHLKSSSNSTFSSLESAASLGAITANTQYFLTVAVGHRIDLDAADATISLLAGGKAIQSITIPASAIPRGTFADFIATYTTLPGDPLTGMSLGIRLRADRLPGPGADLETSFDNVRLTATTVPEPTAMFLPAVFVMLARRRH